MKKVKVNVEKVHDGTYWCRTEAVGKGCLSGSGDTVAGAKADLMDCLTEARAAGDFPDVEFVFHYDLQSFFDYFKFLNVSEVAKMAGINKSLMLQYTSGKKNAGEKTYKRLAACLDGMRRDFASAVI